jgi:copper homeostasis protein
MLLEICVEDAAGLQAALAGGADRIELCAALGVGGLSASPAMMQLAASLPIPVRALCRPRAGDFDYDDNDLALVEADAIAAIRYGLDGIVIGAGTRTALDATGLERIVRRAKAVAAEHGRDLGLTLHRAFDTIADMPAALDTAIALGFDTVLTSGGERRAQDGAAMLAALVARAGDRITILAGSGVDVAAVPVLAAAGIRAFHASCRRRAPEPSHPDLHRLGFVEEKPLRTDAQSVRQLRQALADHGKITPSPSERLNNTNI